jgi:hypothetical protein
MKAVLKALYTEPILFLAAVQTGLTALAAASVITGWIPVVSLAIITALQRNYVKPAKAARR